MDVLHQGVCLSGWLLLLRGRLVPLALAGLLLYSGGYLTGFAWFHYRSFPRLRANYLPYPATGTVLPAPLRALLPTHYWNGLPAHAKAASGRWWTPYADATATWGCLFAAYTPRHRAFGAAAVLRTVLLGLLGALPVACEVQLGLMLATLGLYLCLLIALRPYRSRGCNVLQALIIADEMLTAVVLLLQSRGLVGASVVNAAVMSTLFLMIASNLWGLACFLHNRSSLTAKPLSRTNSVSSSVGDSNSTAESPSTPAPATDVTTVHRSTVTPVSIELVASDEVLDPIPSTPGFTVSFADD